MAYPETKAGLPEAEDYDPDAIGTAELKAGAPEQTWPEYGLELVPVMMDGEDTGRRLIRRNGEYVSDVSEDYKLLPNERLVRTANEVAEELGAVPFHEFSGDWFVRLDDHVFQNPQRTQVHALYAWDDPVDIGGGDEIQVGFAVHNSIDSSLGFKVGLFTFRHACANMVFMGIDTSGMSFDDREVLSHSSHKHTQGLVVDRDQLRNLILDTVQFQDDIYDNYSAWQDMRVDPADVLELIETTRLPDGDLPEWAQQAQGSLRKAEENQSLGGSGQSLTPERKAEIVEAEMPSGTTVWDTYNDITENIWHSDKTQYTSKLNKMRVLHKTYSPGEHLK